jgi:hypothetical protein
MRADFWGMITAPQLVSGPKSMNLFPCAAFAIVALGVTSATADDWTAVQLRGQVLQLVNDQWQPLQRGMVVPDSRHIRTLGSGRVTLKRGKETLSLRPDTEIQIHDRGTPAKPDTTVSEYAGTVSVEAQVEDVQHFAVETSVLAAVVKGTKFTVHAGKTGAAVSVQRGHVEVDDHRNGSHVLISIGQSASIDLAKGNDLTVVEGSGSAPAVTSENASPGPDFGVTSTPDSPAGGGPANAGNGKGNSGSGNGNCGPNGKHSSGNGGI